MSLAPILVSVYTRREHLDRCIQSLKNNDLSKQSLLYVVSDAPASECHREQVAAVRKYIDTIEGFSEIRPILRPVNLGSFSINQAVSDLLSVHDRLILLEDDNIVSTNFLSYMNAALDFYENDSSVFSISGYNYPVVMPESYIHDVYKWQGYSGWGVGYWRDRYTAVEWDYPDLTEIARGKPVRRGLDHIAEHLCRQMIYDLKHGKRTGDTMVTYYMYRHGLYSVFPTISKVRNTGHDGTGEHTGVTDRYLRQAIDPGLPYRFVRDLQPDEQINRVLRRHFSTPFKAKTMQALSPLIPARPKNWLKRILKVQVTRP